MKKDRMIILIMISLMLGTRSIRILNISKEMHHIISTTTKPQPQRRLKPTTSCCEILHPEIAKIQWRHEEKLVDYFSFSSATKDIIVRT